MTYFIYIHAFLSIRKAESTSFDRSVRWNAALTVKCKFWKKNKKRLFNSLSAAKTKLPQQDSDTVPNRLKIWMGWAQSFRNCHPILLSTGSGWNSFYKKCLWGKDLIRAFPIRKHNGSGGGCLDPFPPCHKMQRKGILMKRDTLSLQSQTIQPWYLCD